MTSVTIQGEAKVPSKFWVLLTASLVSSLIMLDSNIVAVSLPAIGRSLGASFTDVQWVISAYILTYASLLLASGGYADLRGRKKSMLIGLVIFAVASATCGLATDSLMLNLSRAAQGVGGAFLLTASLAILSNAFTTAERNKAFAFWGASLGIALPVGPIHRRCDHEFRGMALGVPCECPCVGRPDPGDPEVHRRIPRSQR
jgi:MFS family permease